MKQGERVSAGPSDVEDSASSPLLLVQGLHQESLLYKRSGLGVRDDPAPRDFSVLAVAASIRLPSVMQD
jgi:hypothetical protein